MTTFRRALSIPATALASLMMAACNGATTNRATESSPAPVVTEPVIVPTVAIPQPDTTGAATASTASDTMPPPVTAAPTTAARTTDAPTTTADPNAPVRITLTVGATTAPDRRDTVRVGQVVELAITNPSADDEFHMHHFDLGGGSTVPAGQTATFTFVADAVGEYELESHATHAVLMTLVVVE